MWCLDDSPWMTPPGSGAYYDNICYMMRQILILLLSKKGRQTVYSDYKIITSLLSDSMPSNVQQQQH